MIFLYVFLFWCLPGILTILLFPTLREGFGFYRGNVTLIVLIPAFLFGASLGPFLLVVPLVCWVLSWKIWHWTIW